MKPTLASVKSGPARNGVFASWASITPHVVSRAFPAASRTAGSLRALEDVLGDELHRVRAELGRLDAETLLRSERLECQRRWRFYSPVGGVTSAIGFGGVGGRREWTLRRESSQIANERGEGLTCVRRQTWQLQLRPRAQRPVSPDDVRRKRFEEPSSRRTVHLRAETLDEASARGRGAWLLSGMWAQAHP